VRDQGSIGSCTAHALVSNLEFLQRKAAQRRRHLSRLFVYYNARLLEGTADKDDGAMIRNGVKTLRKQGVCPEIRWPYRVRHFADQPAEACYHDALAYVVLSYHRIHGLNEMRQCLAEGYPFVFGMKTYSGFEGEKVAETGQVDLPVRGEKEVGAHSVCAVGYDDREGRLIVRNSWGPLWGEGGYFTLPYVYAANHRRASDFWTLRAFANK
jgi:C1A family cysteine protease